MTNEQTAADILAESFREILPKGAHKHIAALVDEAMSAVDGVCSIEAVGAHIEVETITYPNGSVSIDAAGNLVRADFDGPCHVDVLI